MPSRKPSHLFGALYFFPPDRFYSQLMTAVWGAKDCQIIILLAISRLIAIRES